MLFTSLVVKSLTEDHKKLRKEIQILKNLDIPQSEKRLALACLLPYLSSHTNREERVIYSFMKLSDEDELRIWALEGKEEHVLVNKLINKMLDVDIKGEEWIAKAKVLAELLEHHINEEEESIFPTLVRELDEEVDAQLSIQFETNNHSTSLNRDFTKEPTTRHL
jgi:hemerythrin-like domain-containing protein